MVQVNFNDKQNGDFFTAENVNELKQAVNTNESRIGNATVSGYIDLDNQIKYNTHIVPQYNERFDIGDAGNKIRNLFLSSCSIWMHDDIKIDVYNGSVRSLTRDKTNLPNYITGILGGTVEAATGFANVSSVEEMSLKNIEDYAKSLDETVKVADIFPDYYSDNYTESDYSDIKILDKELSSNASYKTINASEQLNAPENAVEKNYFNINLSESSNFILNGIDNQRNICRFNLTDTDNESAFYEANFLVTGASGFQDLILPSFRWNGGLIDGPKYYHEIFGRSESDQNNSDNLLIKTFLKINSNPSDLNHPSGDMMIQHHYFNNGALTKLPKYLPRSNEISFTNDTIRIDLIGDSVGNVIGIDSQTVINEGDEIHYWKLDEIETLLTFYISSDGTTTTNDLIAAPVRYNNGLEVPSADINITLVNGDGTDTLSFFGASFDPPEDA